MNPQRPDRARHDLCSDALSRDDAGVFGVKSAGFICLVCGARIATANMRTELERWATSLRVEALAVAEQHIAEGDTRLARQQEIIDRLRRGGHELRPALRILQRLEINQRLHVADRARLIDALYQD